MALWQHLRGKGFFITLSGNNRFKLILLIFGLFSIYIFIFSESGLLERNRLKSKYELLQQKILQKKQANEQLQRRLEEYRAGNYSQSDIAASGLIYSDGKVIIFDENYKLKEENFPQKNMNFEVDLFHLRIIWIIISIMVVVYYINRIKMKEESSDG